MDGFYSDIWRSAASFDWGISPGVIAIGVASNSNIQILSTTDASGGEGAITYSWYHSTAAPTDTDYGTPISGSSATNDDSRTGQLTVGNHYYTRVATDTYGRRAITTAMATVDFERSWGLDRYHMIRRK